MLEISKLTHNGPDHTLAFQGKLYILTTGNFLGLAVGFAVQLGLKSLLFKLQLMCGQGIGQIVLHLGISRVIAPTGWRRRCQRCPRKHSNKYQDTDQS